MNRSQRGQLVGVYFSQLVKKKKIKLKFKYNFSQEIFPIVFSLKKPFVAQTEIHYSNKMFAFHFGFIDSRFSCCCCCSSHKWSQPTCRWCEPYGPWCVTTRSRKGKIDIAMIYFCFQHLNLLKVFCLLSEGARTLLILIV